MSRKDVSKLLFRFCGQNLEIQKKLLDAFEAAFAALELFANLVHCILVACSWVRVSWLLGVERTPMLMSSILQSWSMFHMALYFSHERLVESPPSL